MKELTYYVTKDNITPKDIIEIGYAGEHNATRVIFELSDELIDADSYLMNIVTGGGEFLTTDHLILSENKIIYDLPSKVTAVSGILKLRLVINANQMVAFSYPCELRVLSLGQSEGSALSYLSEISDALNICKEAAKKADETIKNVKDNSDLFLETIGDIDAALEEIIFIQQEFIGGNL